MAYYNSFGLNTGTENLYGGFHGAYDSANSLCDAIDASGNCDYLHTHGYNYNSGYSSYGGYGGSYGSGIFNHDPSYNTYYPNGQLASGKLSGGEIFAQVLVGGLQGYGNAKIAQSQAQVQKQKMAYQHAIFQQQYSEIQQQKQQAMFQQNFATTMKMAMMMKAMENMDAQA